MNKEDKIIQICVLEDFDVKVIINDMLIWYLKVIEKCCSMYNILKVYLLCFNSVMVNV